MYTMTYTTLQEDVRNYLERGFTAASDSQVYAQIPRLITLAERRAARDLKVQGFIRAVTTTLSVGVGAYVKPDRWRDTISMTIGGRPIFARAYEYMRNYWPVEATTGTPEFYGDYDYTHWLVVPTPATAETLEVLYYEQPAFLGDDNATNWLTEFAPDVLLYATLLECMPFLKDDERIATWEALYAKAAGSLSNEDIKRIADRAAARTES